MPRYALQLAPLFLALTFCSSPQRHFDFHEPAEFAPYDEHLVAANRTIRILAEGPGTLDTGESLYYIAYETRERVVAGPSNHENDHPNQDVLWGETQALWAQRRAQLDPDSFEFVIIDAYRFSSSSPSLARRAVFESEKGSWRLGRSAQFILRR